MNWIKINEEDNTTLPEFGKEVLIVSEEGRISVEYRMHKENFIYSHQTDSGCAKYWMELPELPKDFN
jgi:hypothetical protein